MPRPRKANGSNNGPELAGAYGPEQHKKIKEAFKLAVEYEQAKADAVDGLKDVTANLKDAGVLSEDRRSLKKYAAIEVKGGREKAAAQLASLHTIGLILGEDLFAVAGITLGEQAAPARGDNVYSMAVPPPA